MRAALNGLARALRFAASGVLNTLAGYALILLARELGAAELAANALGYAGGLALSFMLHRRWVFADRVLAAGASWRFLVVAAAAWALNAACVLGWLNAGVAGPWAHALGIPVYAFGVYLGSLCWVFQRPAPDQRGRS